MINKHGMLANVSRSSLVIIFFMLLFFGFMNNLLWPVYLNVFLILGDLGNHFLLKNGLFKFLYKNYGFKDKYGKTRLPILGIYERPHGASYCGLFQSPLEKIPKSMGMSSGHAQFIFTFVAFMLYYLNNTNKKLIILIIGFILAISRIYPTNCHTVQQVIVGSIIGFLYGCSVYKLLESFDKID